MSIQKIEFKTSTGTRIVFRKAKPDFSKAKSKDLSVPMIGNAISQANPWESMGLGVHPSQVKEFNEMYAAAGITGAGHKEDGTLVTESRQSRNKVLKLRGCRDNDAGYGDYSGENS